MKHDITAWASRHAAKFNFLKNVKGEGQMIHSRNNNSMVWQEHCSFFFSSFPPHFPPPLWSMILSGQRLLCATCLCRTWHKLAFLGIAFQRQEHFGYQVIFLALETHISVIKYYSQESQKAERENWRGCHFLHKKMESWYDHSDIVIRTRKVKGCFQPVSGTITSSYLGPRYFSSELLNHTSRTSSSPVTMASPIFPVLLSSSHCQSLHCKALGAGNWLFFPMLCHTMGIDGPL